MRHEGGHHGDQDEAEVAEGDVADQGDRGTAHLEGAVLVGRVDHEGVAEGPEDDDEDVVGDLEQVEGVGVEEDCHGAAPLGDICQVLYF